jgi:hypothetical protein
MSGKEGEKELPDLKAIREALGSLVPRRDRLDRERLMFLAGQASREPNEEGAADAADGHLNATPGLFVVSRQIALHAGNGRRPHRWGWPAAFAGMSTVAAGLLVALVLRPPRVVERIVEVPVASPSAVLAHEDGHQRDVPLDDAMTPAPRQPIERPGGWMALVLASFEKKPWASFSPADGASYMQLREMALSQGLSAWPTSQAVAAAGGRASSPQRPSSQREMLDELLEKPEARRPQRPGVTPESTFHPGVKS